MIGIYCNNQEILELRSSTIDSLYNQIKKDNRKKNLTITRDQDELMNKLFLASMGYDFNFDVFRTKSLAFFLINWINETFEKLQQGLEPISPTEAQKLLQLRQAIEEYTKHLPDVATIMHITWYRNDAKTTLLAISCNLYEKFREKLAPYIKNSSFTFGSSTKEGILYRLEAGSYGFDIGIDNFLYTKLEILEFAKYVKQALEDIQKSNEPFDAETEKKINEFYQKLLTIAEQTNRGKQL